MSSAAVCKALVLPLNIGQWPRDEFWKRCQEAWKHDGSRLLLLCSSFVPPFCFAAAVASEVMTLSPRLPQPMCTREMGSGFVRGWREGGTTGAISFPDGWTRWQNRQKQKKRTVRGRGKGKSVCWLSVIRGICCFCCWDGLGGGCLRSNSHTRLAWKMGAQIHPSLPPLQLAAASSSATAATQSFCPNRSRSSVQALDKRAKGFWQQPDAFTLRIRGQQTHHHVF